ncbi:MAG: hypothetical protein Q8K16_03490, partial [Algoriphagus sp.]|nr:hypothetical protein [Algoriphagus sp.]
MAISFFLISFSVFAQDPLVFRLPQMLTEGSLEIGKHEVTNGEKGGREFLIVGKNQAEKPIWLPINDFQEGKIELVAKGKDILQGSFYGLVFHAENDSIFDVVYCRP